MNRGILALVMIVVMWGTTLAHAQTDITGLWRPLPRNQDLSAELK